MKDTVIKLSDAKTIWVKKKMNIDDKENESLVWCIEEIEEKKTAKLNYLLDTTLTKEFELELFPLMKLVESGGYTKWCEIVCEKDLNPEFISRIQDVLIAEKFIIELNEPTSIIDKETKSGIVKYQ